MTENPKSRLPLGPTGPPETAEGRPNALVFGVVAVILGLALMIGVAFLASRGDVEVQLGNDRFEVGNAERRAESIERDNFPLLFNDPNPGRNRALWINHVGDRASRGWHAFDVLVPGENDCELSWAPDERIFVAPCAEDGYGPDGEPLGNDDPPLRRAIAVVEDGTLIVDLRTAAEPTP